MYTLEDKTYYKLNQYVLHELETGEIVLQNAKGIVRINEPRLKNFVKKWDEYGNSLLPYEEFEETFGEDTKEALIFLKTYQIIEEKVKPNLGIKRIRLYTNNPEVGLYIKQILETDYRHALEISSLCDKHLESEQIIVENGDLVVVFLNPYNRKKAREIRDRVKGFEQSFLLFTYVYNYTFYMDALYNGFLKSPCHICHISYIESQIRISNQGNITYQHMIDSLYAERPSFPITTPLTQNNIFNIVTQITNRISKLILLDETPVVHAEAFLESSMFDLITKELHTDNPIHWELCDCYE
ncbi:McbB family protein [Geobacillus stearothermophilus]|uniref:McbB family protein n=1 Tax=Parageobacillus toebii TaxID=153151 RepID=A0A150MUQ8_9BACL|nr:MULTISPECIES: McbB family protein [Bacillaceae]KOR94821.1 hypothetical protein N231_05430 [Geobacillus stearothermophilus ATCC 12980]KYD28191.1 hypothetical protein B4110_3734 [Parageobacillus toebii]MED4880749.1 McbB family protein [Geobacillus stearothermophilus]MED5010674.1 McbB family protein [Geobacillus stearothermophilus]MED5015236.1 McbB family protein [Geobacillus stearothermophilus]